MPELDRRDFLKVVGLSAGAAASAACQEPVEKVIPYLVQPEEIVPGLPTYYASTCRECPNACATTVKTREGRPIKVDGNPDDPVTRGALCVRGQASLHRTFDPLRFRGPMRRKGEALEPVTWEQGLHLLLDQLRSAGRKVAFLGGAETGTLDALIDAFLASLGSSQRIQFELYAHEALRSADQIVFGSDALPRFDLEAADLVVAFGTDFAETWLNPVQNARGYAEARRDGKGFSVFVGPRLGMSGANTDLWIAPVPGTEIFVALGLAHEVGGNGDPRLRDLLAPFSAERVAERTGVGAGRIRELASRIRDAKAPLALPPGNELQGTNATSFVAAVQILNWVSGAVGSTVVFGPNHNVGRISRFRDVKELAGQMRGGEIDVLFVHDANPLYAVPAAFGFADALRQVSFVVCLSSAPDETTALAHLVLPTHTPFEAWGDAEPIAGIRRLQQPTIRPLFDTRELGDVLLEVARGLDVAQGLPSGSFHDHLVSRWGGAAIDAALARGGDFRPAAKLDVELAPGVASLEFAPAQLGGQDDLVLVAYPSLHFYDGRSARLNRLQEIPDPVTKGVWGSYAEMHPDTAKNLGVREGDVVRVRTEDGKGEVALPAFPHEAVRRGVVAIMVGQGHVPLEPDIDLSQRWGQQDWLARSEVHGVNVLAMLPGRLDPVSGGLAWYSAKVRVEKTGEWQRVNKTQPTFDQEGRGFAQATTLAALAGGEDLDEQPHMATQPFDPADDPATLDSPYRWGMSIDLDACNGCNACVAACAQENNIPTIGPELTARGREMFWIRIERYVEHNGDELDVRDVPMLCQHCGAAPCENVCPVLATYHNPEGLNVMVYNRCIGTRYCSNNCPYKVRRFNYLPYDLEVREPEHLALNPDVTVRSKGVMEKCTFCIQRIQYEKDRADQDGRGVVGDGEMVTACQQTCPTEAIVFGNLKDRESRVAKLRGDDRRYLVLEHLYTQPAVSYLKKIRRGETHPAGEHHG